MRARGPGIPRLVFDDLDRPGEEQFRTFHDTVAPLFDTRPRRPLHEFWATATDYLVDEVVLSATAFAAQSLHRSEDVALRPDSDWLAVVVTRSGRLFGDAGDVALDVGPGDVTVVNMARPFSLHSDGADLLWACVRRGLLPAPVRPAPDAPARQWEASRPEAEAVGSAIEAVWSRLPDAAGEDAARLAGLVLDVVGAAVAPGPFVAPPAAGTAAVKQYVRDNLHDLDLGVATLRDRFHCSRSSLYRAFEAEGGVAAHIRELRLQQCFEELTSPTLGQRSISEVATRWGFENPSHFHRLFTTMFGRSPSVARREARDRAPESERDPGTAAQIERFHRWARAV